MCGICGRADLRGFKEEIVSEGGKRMRHAVLLLMAAFGVAVLTTPPAMAQTAKVISAAQSWTQPKTPWGDPDLQGTWTSDDCIGTPMNRPVNLGEKLYYTEEDLAQREGQLARQRQNDAQE